MRVTTNSIIKLASKFGYFDFCRIGEDKIKFRFSKSRGRSEVMEKLLKEVKMQIINDLPNSV